MNKEDMGKYNLKPDTIYRVHPDMLDVLKDIAVLGTKTKHGELNPIGFFRYLNINTPTGKTIPLVSFNEKGNIITCMVVTLHIDEMMEKMVWIDFAWKDPKVPDEINNKYMNYLKDIAKSFGAKVIRTQMSRGYKAAMKKYNFKYAHTTLELEVAEDVKETTEKDN